MAIRKTVFPERVAEHWNRLPREVLEAACLQVFESCVDVALWDTVW